MMKRVLMAILASGLIAAPALAEDVTADNLKVKQKGIFGLEEAAKTPERPVSVYENTTASTGINIESANTEADIRVTTDRFVIGLGAPVAGGTPGRFSLDTAGQVAIGTPTPQATLHVQKSSAPLADLRIQNSVGYFNWVLDGSQAKLQTRKFGPGATTIDQFVVDHDTSKVTFTGEASATVVEIRGGADVAEPFVVNGAEAVGGTVEPGTVVCIDAEKPGELTVAMRAYDKRVAGIVSGAGGINAGLILGGKPSAARGEVPVALSGKVYCKVDASQGGIEPGDLLTTSDTPGHAMKVEDHGAAPGAVIGKAMSALPAGETGLVLVLVNLH